jgi:uncharacterized membrane protein
MKFKLSRNFKYSIAFFLVIFFAGLIGQPFPHGYLHPADPLVMMAAVLLPAPYAIAISAAACVAVDLIKGYYLLSLTTLVIKILMVLAVKGLLKLKASEKFPDLVIAPVALIPIPIYYLSIALESHFIRELALHEAFAYACRTLQKDTVQGAAGMLLFMLLYTGYKKLKNRRNTKKSEV